MIGRMHTSFSLTLFLAGVVFCEESRVKSGHTCDESEGAGDIFTLVADRRLNRTSGEWLRTFHARKVDTENSTGTLELEASQGTVECGGKRIMHIRVLVKEVKENGTIGKEKDDRLVFHPRHGKNAIISDNGRSVQKLDLNDDLNAVVFTHRPLKDNELFEVRLDNRIVKKNHCFALGVMTHSPDTVNLAPSMHTLPDGTWVYHNNAIYGSARELSKYGRDLNKIQPGDRLGVLRREDGSIHYYMNGADLGRAVASVPGPVYGIFEVWYDAVKGTIVS